VHLEHERGVRPDRALVVGDVGAVGGADLAQPGADRLDQVRDPEAVADLDELSARDYDLPAGGERRGDECEGGGPVVDQVRSGGTGHGGEQRGEHTCAAATTGAGGEVQLDVARAGGDGQGFAGGRAQRRPAEVGVQHDPGGVEHGEQRRGCGRQRGECRVGDGLRSQGAVPHPLLRGGDGRLDQRPAQPGGGCGDPGVGEHRVRAGYPAAVVGACA
jgi:hypothetical protein